jgi:GNAT superfamily N-acetyltransferase
MIRPAQAADIPAIHQMIMELATYERSLHEVSATEDDLRAALLAGPAEAAGRPSLFAHVAEEDGQAVGFALWFLSYSTWLGRHGIHLEDLYVKPEWRGQGHGRALLAELARICAERGYGRLEWSVLDWNSAARRLYESLGAAAVDEWVIYRLAGPALHALAGDGR